MSKRRRIIDEPTMSDKTLLLNVEDLIQVAFGAAKLPCTVDFKLIQSILHILAREMRLLEQDVELKLGENEDIITELNEKQIISSEDEDAGGKRDKDGKKDKKQDKDQEKSGKTKKGEVDDKKLTEAEQVGEGKRGKRDKKKEKETETVNEDEKKSGKKKKDGKQTGQDNETEDQTRGREKGEGISVKETSRKGKRGDKETVLVVEKGPTTRDSRTRVGSIEVVTREEFNLLGSRVDQLSSLKGPLPMPTMPDNKQLKSALAKGTASLTDTMGALQVNARVQAAEQALTCMAGLLTQLAAAGAIPEELADALEQMTSDVRELSRAAEAATTGLEGTPAVRPKSVMLDPLSARDSGKSTTVTGKGLSSATSGVSLAPKMSASVASKVSTISTSNMAVTRNDMEDALQLMKTDLLNKITNITSKDAATIETANNVAQSVVDKMETALKMDKRISDLYGNTKEYAEQLRGFDSGLATQMSSFQEQIMQMRADLQGGLKQLDNVNNNAETAAVADLRVTYDLLVMELDTTVHTHTALVTVQKELGDDLKSLIANVEMLREQKADRDEVRDGLRDKADLSRLMGLLNSDAFEQTRSELEKRLDLCYEKFNKQDLVWINALKDLSDIASTKADLSQLMGLRDFATESLSSLQDLMRRLEILLGEPKAAVITRRVSAGAQCGACALPALISPRDAHYGTPAPLPPLTLHRRPPPPPTEPCTTDLSISAPPDAREHICHRWVGGSHTLVSEHTTRERAPPLQLQTIPTKRYTAYGTDGRLYRFEEELQPCVECNHILAKEDDVPPPSEAGDGDRKREPERVENTDKLKEDGTCDCNKATKFL